MFLYAIMTPSIHSIFWEIIDHLHHKTITAKRPVVEVIPGPTRSMFEKLGRYVTEIMRICYYKVMLQRHAASLLSPLE